MRSESVTILATRRPLTAVFADDLELAWEHLDQLAQTLDAGARLLACRCEVIPRLDALIDDILVALAQQALADWPCWYGVCLSSLARSNSFERNQSLREQVLTLSRGQAGISKEWLLRASENCLAGKPPFDSGASRELQARQLCLAIWPKRLVMAMGVGQGAQVGDAPALIAAAEWLHRVAGATMLLLMPAHWHEEPAVQRAAFACEWLRFAAGVVDSPATDVAPRALSMRASPLPGRPHPASAAEQELYRRIIADAELSPLLEFNQPVAVDLGQCFRVDVLCRARKVAVEIDGESSRDKPEI